jgi:hypothetical protein
MLTLKLGFNATAIDRVVARHHLPREMPTQRPHESLTLALVVALVGQQGVW